MDPSDTESTSTAASGSATLPPTPRRRRPQFGLSTMMLLILAVASWAAHWQARSELTRIQAELPRLREISRQLQVDDPTQYAVARHHETWNDDYRWRIYLPPRYRHQLKLATEQVDQQGLPEAAQQGEIAAGEHEVELNYEKVDERWQIAVFVDGQVVVADERPVAWNAGRGSSGGAQFSESRQQPVVLPLELFRRRFMVPTDPTSHGGRATVPAGPCDGILLWIESEADGPPKGAQLSEVDMPS